jgi:epoxide hydrolase-like predicted phosphatase
MIGMPRPTQIRAVVFDIGGVLEKVDNPEAWLGKWRRRLGLTEAEFEAAAATTDRSEPAMTGGVTEAESRQRWVEALRLSEADADEFVRDMWDWYCGELDAELMGYAAGLRPAFTTAILSNSGPGAREQEESRYGFSTVFDPIVYSHEVGMQKPDPRIYALTCDLLQLEPQQVVFLDDTQVSVDGATAAGMHAVLHHSTPDSIRAIDALLGSA